VHKATAVAGITLQLKDKQITVVTNVENVVVRRDSVGILPTGYVNAAYKTSAYTEQK
jgi:hypothetical protein